MTPHIFRKYPGYNPNEIKDWTPSKVIDTTNFDVENIVTSKGSSKAGTSIPSPLARMELFDTAFHIVASDKASLKGRTIYHQLVSDCLDILQLIFNIKNADIGLGKKLWFKEWKVRENIDKLKAKGTSHPNYILGKSLDQIFSDRINPRFTGVDSIFLIFYENKLLGGTSPLTLFFTSPNWSRYIKEIRNIPQSSDGDVFFDDDYKALFERDKVFVEYVYKLLLQNKDAFDKAEGFRSYINKTVDTHFSGWRNEFAEFQAATSNTSEGIVNLMDADYDKVLTNVENKYLTINGLYFYHQQEGKEKEKIKNVSDFVIRASTTKYSRQKNEKGEEQIVYPPLVLVDGMNYSGDYMERNSPWSSNTKIRDWYHINVPLYERKLPQGNSQSITYPFVTTDDFLENFLVEMPFNINKPKFYTGFSGDFRYLLPIKKEYFNFFSLAELKTNLSITIDDTSQVKVNLKVPVKSRKGVPDILFSRTYSKAKGTVVECRSDIGIYPFYQVADSDLNDYTILLANRIERDKNKEELALHFFSLKNFAADEMHLENSPLVRSVFDSGATATSKYYRLKMAFDFMEMTYHFDDIGSQCRGLILPDFSSRTYNKGNMIKSFTFALDFGTSNTHIAWMENGEALPRPFEIEPADQQMVLLNEPLNTTDLSNKYAAYGRFPEIDLILRREFLPAVITSKDNADVSFPFKTASCEVIDFSNTEKSKADLFSHINVGYYIDKEEKKGNVIYTTNLKWLLENNNDDTNKSRVKLFLQQLFWQIKTKAILNNGKLSDLKVVWSVPLSMGRGNRTTLQAVLRDAFTAVFNNSGAVLENPIPESVAPYFYLTKSGTGIQDIANAINIDIGGGTSDVMMFMESAGASRTDKYVTTSFRFAGSDLWGSGYKGKLKDNGFIRNYLAYQKANNINPAEEIKYFNNGKEDGNLNADDVISLLFKYDNKFRFSDSITIGNPNLSLLLYLHFSAIIYHVVQIIEAKKYPLPRYLSFTGKGSQYIKLMCGGDESELEAFTKLLIRTYTELPLQSSFKIHLNSNPKEITANGSVLYSLSGNEEKQKYQGNFEFVHAGFNPKTSAGIAERLVSEDKKFLIADTLDINSPLNVAVLNNVNLFLEKTLTSRSIIDFLNDFKIKNLKTAYDTLKWNGDIDNGEGLVYDSYRKVLNNLRNGEKENQLPESLFFFALKDALYQLSKLITDTKN